MIAPVPALTNVKSWKRWTKWILLLQMRNAEQSVRTQMRTRGPAIVPARARVSPLCPNCFASCRRHRRLGDHDLKNVRQNFFGFREPPAFRDARNIHKPLFKFTHRGPEFHVAANSK